MDLRCCKDCGVPKPLSDFASAGTVNGVLYYRHKCKSCYTRFKNARRKRNKEWLQEYKKALKCADCGNDDFRVLEFHHLGDKDADIADVAGSWSRERTLAEIAKCDVLCANCHRIRHYNQGVAQFGRAPVLGTGGSEVQVLSP